MGLGGRRAYVPPEVRARQQQQKRRNDLKALLGCKPQDLQDILEDAAIFRVAGAEISLQRRRGRRTTPGVFTGRFRTSGGGGGGGDHDDDDDEMFLWVAVKNNGERDVQVEMAHATEAEFRAQPLNAGRFARSVPSSSSSSSSSEGSAAAAAAASEEEEEVVVVLDSEHDEDLILDFGEFGGAFAAGRSGPRPPGLQSSSDEEEGEEAVVGGAAGVPQRAHLRLLNWNPKTALQWRGFILQLAREDAGDGDGGGEDSESAGSAALKEMLLEGSSTSPAYLLTVSRANLTKSAGKR